MFTAFGIRTDAPISKRRRLHPWYFFYITRICFFSNSYFVAPTIYYLFQLSKRRLIQVWIFLIITLVHNVILWAIFLLLQQAIKKHEDILFFAGFLGLCFSFRSRSVFRWVGKQFLLYIDTPLNVKLHVICFRVLGLLRIPFTKHHHRNSIFKTPFNGFSAVRKWCGRKGIVCNAPTNRQAEEDLGNGFNVILQPLLNILFIKYILHAFNLYLE